MSSPISSALDKLDGSLVALRAEVDCLRAGLEVEDEQLKQRLSEAYEHAATVRDLIRAERADAAWSDREALDLLVVDLQAAARNKLNEERRNRLLELASEFEAGSIKHRFESRVAALNALRQEAIEQLRADASLAEQEKNLPGPEASEWLHWACNLQEDSDGPALETLHNDFPAIEQFTGEMEESYWVPGTRAPITSSAASQPVVRAVQEVKPPQPAPQVAKPPAPTPPAPQVAKAPVPPTPAPQVAKPPAPTPPAPQVAKPPAPTPPAPQVAKPPAPTPPAPQVAKPPAPTPPAPQVAKPPVPPQPAPQVTKPTPPAPQVAKAPTQSAPQVAKAPAVQPVIPAGVKVAAAAASLDRTQQKVAAQAKPAASASSAAAAMDRPSTEAGEASRGSAAAPTWHAAVSPAAAAAAPAKEAPEKSAAAAPRMKYCDKCGSTYPSQFNVCPIDTAVLRFADETPGATAAVPDKKAEERAAAATVAVVAAASAASSKKKRAEQATETVVSREPARPAANTARDSKPASVAERKPVPRHDPDEPDDLDEHSTSDWKELLREKDWRGLAAHPVILTAATLLLVLVLGTILWRAHRSHVASDSVRAMEKAPDQPAGNTSAGIVTSSVAQPVSTQPPATAATKPPDQNAANKPPAKDAQPKPDTPPRQSEVLNLPMPAPRDVASAKKPESPSNEPIEQPSAIPGALPNSGSNGLGAIGKDIPVSVPTLTPQKLRVSSGVAQAQLTHQVNPQYPPDALQSRVHGTVVLQAVIGKDGNVKNLKVVSGPSLLVKSATEAVKQWRYKPFTLNGDPVEADTQINVNFTIGEQ